MANLFEPQLASKKLQLLETYLAPTVPKYLPIEFLKTDQF
jgi:hypothetical protein